MRKRTYDRRYFWIMFNLWSITEDQIRIYHEDYELYKYKKIVVIDDISKKFDILKNRDT